MTSDDTNIDNDSYNDVDQVSDNTGTSQSDLTDTTGYSSDEDHTMAAAAHFSVINPMIVVSNRLPFVLKRSATGELERKSR